MKEHYFSESPTSKIIFYTIKTSLKNQTFKFLTTSGIFSPRYIDSGTRLLIENMQLPKEGNILDLGTGYGVIGIVVANTAPNCKIYMIDLNERAIWLAKENIKRNAITNAEVRVGGLENVKNLKFKLILTNPPLSIGYEKLYSLLSLIPNYFDEDCSFQIVLRKTHKKIISMMESIFTDVEVMKKKSGYIVLKCQVTL